MSVQAASLGFDSPDVTRVRERRGVRNTPLGLVGSHLQERGVGTRQERPPCISALQRRKRLAQLGVRERANMLPCPCDGCSAERASAIKAAWLRGALPQTVCRLLPFNNQTRCAVERRAGAPGWGPPCGPPPCGPPPPCEESTSFTRDS